MAVDWIYGVSGLWSGVNARTLLIFGLVLLLFRWITKKPYGIPPGPSMMLPMLGNLHLLASGDVLGVFRSLRKQHGDVFSFYMGKQLVIVLNGYDTINQALVKKAEVFSGRPQNYIGQIFAKGKGVIFSEGAFWKSQRKFVTNSLQEFGFGRSALEDTIMVEVVSFLEVLEESNNANIDIAIPLHVNVANVIFAITCGLRFSHHDEVILTMLKNSEFVSKELTRVTVLTDCFPFLKYCPGDPLSMAFMMGTFKQFKSWIADWYRVHTDDKYVGDARDFLDHYIREMEIRKRHEDTAEFNYEQMEMIIMDLFGAGTETTAATIRWALLYLLNYQDVKARLFEEIDSVVEDKRMPSLQDREKLPYVEAFIMEVMRISSVAPLAIPHAILRNQETTFMNYRIPKDSVLMINVDSVLMDPTVFPNPNKFDPGRFIDENGKVLKPKQFIPFGIGRRLCLGENVARMELFLFLTAILKTFDIQRPEGEVTPDPCGNLDILYIPTPFKIRAVGRKPLHI